MDRHKGRCAGSKTPLQLTYDENRSRVPSDLGSQLGTLRKFLRGRGVESDLFTETRIEVNAVRMAREDQKICSDLLKTKSAARIVSKL